MSRHSRKRSKGGGRASAASRAKRPPREAAPAGPSLEKSPPAGGSAKQATAKPKKPPVLVDPSDPTLTRKERIAAREERIRSTLEPLEPGERPKWVTISAIVALVLGLANLTAFILGEVADVGLGGGEFIVGGVAGSVLLLIAAVGMWFRRYWAVLGFQVMLALQIVSLSVALLTAVVNVLVALVIVLVIAVQGLLFWKLVRAMARMQMADQGVR